MGCVDPTHKLYDLCDKYEHSVLSMIDATSVNLKTECSPRLNLHFIEIGCVIDAYTPDEHDAS